MTHGIISPMSQTILIEPNDKLKKVYSINLNTYAATDVVDRRNAEDTIELLSILPSINLIISRAQVGEEKTALRIRNFLKERNMDIPMIVLGECKELAGSVLSLKEPISHQVLVEHAAQTLGIKEQELKQKVLPAFIPLQAYYFYEIAHTPCDVYIRIYKGESGYQFVKRLHAQDSFTQEDIAKYEKQGLTHFYIPKDFQQYFVNFVTNNIIQQLEKEDLDFGERLETNSAAYEIVREQIAQVGLDESLGQLAQSCIQSMVTSIKHSPTLSSLLKKLFSNKIGYAYQHAHLVCVVGDFILSKQTWYESKHLELFTIVSFFSDITLKSQEQIRVNTMEELEQSKLSDEQKQSVLGHAKDASEIIMEYPGHTAAIQEIIQQHQGKEDGHGFAQNPSDELHPIAKVFIVADAFVKTMLDPKMPKNKKDILAILYAQYTNPSYQKIIRVLEQKID